MSAAEPWWADWNGTLCDARHHVERRQEAAQWRALAKEVGIKSDRGRSLLRDAAAAQREANRAAECVRYTAHAIEQEATAHALLE